MTADLGGILFNTVRIYNKMPGQTLSKTERLKSYKRIRLLFAEGEKFRVSPILVHYRFITPLSPVPGHSFLDVVHSSLDEDPSSLHAAPSSPVPGPLPSSLQMGVSVSSRYFKRSVDRNLLKRRIRESYRKQKADLKTMLEEKELAMDLFLVYIEPHILSYQEIDTAITEALSKLIRRTASKTGA